MPDFHVREVPPGTQWVYQRLHELEVAVNLELFDEDQTRSPERLLTEYAHERTALKGMLVALAGPAPADPLRDRFGLPVVDEPGKILGAAEFALPLLDNTHLLDDLFIQVAAGHRRQGIGRTLWHQVRRIAADRGRNTILGWTEHLAARPAAEWVRPATGEGELPLDAGTRFAQALGLSLAQVERQSRLELPVAPARLTDLRTQAEASAVPGYRLVSWAGPVPADYLDKVARMNQVLSTDAPTGDIDWRPEVWDAERVRTLTEWEHQTGTGVYTLAVAEDSGEVAGLTHIHCDHTHPERPEQWNTAVVAEHRGHRLGLLVKTANLELLARTFPQAQHIDTWNADENQYMLAINTALGYHLHGLTGGWQAKLS
jgi:GNAT superfamily N-acetyltransferase